MATAIQTIFVCCALLATSVSGTIVNGPQNAALVAGPSLVLRCEADLETARVRWYEYVTDEGNPTQISDNEMIVSHPWSDRLSILHPTATVYDLQINPTQYMDGGVFQCVDANGGGPLYAQLITLQADPECVTNIPENGYVREDQYYTIDCSVHYRGNVAPTITWFGPEPDNIGSSVGNNTAWSAVSLNMTRHMDAQRFRAYFNFTEAGFIQTEFASNVPTWNFTYETADLYVQWSPKSMYYVPVQASYEIGDHIDCHADANPAATYYIQNLGTHETWDGNRVTITEQMVGVQALRCNAANNISDTIYTNDLFFNITVNPRTTTPVPTTPTTTTPPPAEEPCGDLTGRWLAEQPHKVDMCLEINNDNYGRIVGVMRNATDTNFIEIRGRIVPHKYNQVGLTGIWPVNIGTLTFIGICNKCNGVEMLQMNGIVRRGTDNVACDDPGPASYTADYLFHKTSETCGSLIAAVLAGRKASS